MTEGKKPETKKYAPPFSVRLTLGERARLDAEAGQLPVGEYVRSRLFDAPDTRQRVYRRPVQDAEALVEVLAALGNSRMAGNLYQIVRAVNSGELAVTPEQQRDLEEALVNVREMRQWLMVALGLKDGARSAPENALPRQGEDGVSGSGGGGT